MAKEAENIGGGGFPWRIVGWGIAALLLLLPLVTGAPWTASDFVFAGLLFGSVGLAFEFIIRRSGSLAYRSGAALAVIAAFLTIWVNAAVGMIGDGDNPLNLMFAGVLALAFVGAVLVRLQAQRMALVMTMAGGAQCLAGVVGTFTDLRGGILSACFAVPWLLSALLFSTDRRVGVSSSANQGDRT